ncbi:MAG: NYN domain-containing protein [Leptolyngbyaceae cyanobacterium SM2_5_2]|nr:NYN domain-containing protein [Leptolyngbyaceae cyanobacterium SM2_5_2]
MARRLVQPELDLNAKISHLLHSAVAQAHSHHGHLLTEGCSHWLQTTSSEFQRAKITALLDQQPDNDSRFMTVKDILRQLFTPAFRETKAHGQVLQRIEAMLAAAQQPIADALGTTAPSGNPSLGHVEGEALNSLGSGLLLVDAENINMPVALEDFLQTAGQYPIRYRLAFGNWRKLGNRDRAFYRRGYQMIHVPSGKNSADIKMSLEASLISLRDPSIREVFICSADSDLLHLAHALLGQGITPYRVSHNRNGFTILNLANRTKQTFSLGQGYLDHGNLFATADPEADYLDTALPPTIPSLEEMKQWLLDLIWQEQNANPDQPLTIDELGKLFRDCHQVSANQAIQANSGYKSLRQFLVAQDELELYPLPGGKRLAVALKGALAPEANLPEPFQAAADPPPSSATTAQISSHAPGLELVQAPVAQSNSLPTPISSTGPAAQAIHDAQSLEQALVALLWNLSSHQSGASINLSVLSAYFAHVYNEPMSKVLKRIGEPKNLPKFLAKCRSLRVQQQDNGWQVSLTCVS